MLSVNNIQDSELSVYEANVELGDVPVQKQNTLRCDLQAFIIAVTGYQYLQLLNAIITFENY